MHKEGKGRSVRNKRLDGCLGIHAFWSLIISCFGRQRTSKDEGCQAQENDQMEVTVIRDVSGSVENINASNSALKEQLLKQDISHLCKIECLIEELLLRKMAEIDYARQALKKIEDTYSDVVETRDMIDKVHSRILQHVEVCRELVDTLLCNNESF